MVYDVARSCLVLEVGGTTWELTEASAAQQMIMPAPENSNASEVMAYDSARQRVVLYGGNGAEDTWEYHDAVPLDASAPVDGSALDGSAFDASIVDAGSADGLAFDSQVSDDGSEESTITGPSLPDASSSQDANATNDAAARGGANASGGGGCSVSQANADESAWLLLVYVGLATSLRARRRQGEQP
jgi:MYXO-CTERM domain-containing protein